MGVEDNESSGVKTRNQTRKRRASSPSIYELPAKKRLLNATIANGTNKALAVRNQVESPLLRLPAEIRTTIFSYVLEGSEILLTTSQPLRPSRRHSDGRSKNFTPNKTQSWAFIRSSQLLTGLQQERLKLASSLFRNPKLLSHTSKLATSLSLLRTCRQIYHETRFLPFSLNRFSFSSPSLMRAALNSLHPAQIRALNSISVTLNLRNKDDVQAWRDALTVPLIKSFTGLRILHINLNFGFPDIRSHIAPQCVPMNNFLWIELYRFQRLELTSCCVVVSDKLALESPDEGLRSYSSAFAKEMGFRWTRAQMGEVETCIRERLLAKWDESARATEKSTVAVMRRSKRDTWMLW